MNTLSASFRSKRAEYQRLFRLKNKACLNAKARDYYRRNKARIQGWSRCYLAQRKQDPDYVKRTKERLKKWYQNNRESVRGYRRENKARIQAYKKKYNRENKKRIRAYTSQAARWKDPRRRRYSRRYWRSYYSGRRQEIANYAKEYYASHRAKLIRQTGLRAKHRARYLTNGYVGGLLLKKGSRLTAEQIPKGLLRLKRLQLCALRRLLKAKKAA
jgi:hypothetical protein